MVTARVKDSPPDSQERNLARALIIGAGVWAAYSAFNLAVNGVALDEVLAPAQIITGAVQYPPGHPHQIYYPRVFILFNYLGAAQLKVVPNPIVLSATRNFLALFVSTFAPFVLTLLLTRQATWAYLTGALMSSDVLFRLSGVYPLFVFSQGYSQGQVGLFLAILAAGLTLGGYWRTAGFLIGLMPAIHGPLAMLLWAWSGCYVFWAKGRPRRNDLGRFATAWGLGLVICAILGFAILMKPDPAVPAGAYNVQGSGQLIYEHFTQLSDLHRRFPGFQTFAYLVAPVAFFLIGGLLLWNFQGQAGESTSSSARRNCFWVFLFGVFAWAYLYSAVLFQGVFGSLPHFVEMTMPLRYSNLAVVLTLPLLVAGFALLCERMGPTERVTALVLLLLIVFTAAGLRALEGGAWLYRGRVADSLIFVLWGVFFAMDGHVHAKSGRRLSVTLAAVAAVGLTLLSLSQWTRGGVIFLAAFFLTWTALAASRKVASRWSIGGGSWKTALRGGWVGACVVLSVAALNGRDVDPRDRYSPRWDVLSNYDRRLNQWLAANAQPGEMILGPMAPRAEIQSKTGHPVLIELETMWLMTYKPSLAPVIGSMVRDIFEIDYADAEQLRRLAPGGRLKLDSPGWNAAWEKRRREEWQALGRKYSFRLVLSPTPTRLDLPAVLPGPLWTLYVIP